MLSETVYFEKAGVENTDATLKIAKIYAEENNIKSVVLASTTGYTAQKAADILTSISLMVVTHVTGYKEPNEQQFPTDLRRRLESSGVRVLTTTHCFSGVNMLEGSSSIGQIIMNTLRMLSEGAKAAVEIAAMATDCGLIRTDEEIISIAGTGKGADTALVIKPANSKRIFNMKIMKILAKPI